MTDTKMDICRVLLIVLGLLFVITLGVNGYMNPQWDSVEAAE